MKWGFSWVGHLAVEPLDVLPENKQIQRAREVKQRRKGSRFQRWHQLFSLLLSRPQLVWLVWLDAGNETIIRGWIARFSIITTQLYAQMVKLNIAVAPHLNNMHTQQCPKCLCGPFSFAFIQQDLSCESANGQCLHSFLNTAVTLSLSCTFPPSRWAWTCQTQVQLTTDWFRQWF